MKPIQALFLIPLLASSIASAAIFGSDSRVAITQSSPAFSLSRSTAVAVLQSLHTDSRSGFLKLELGSMTETVCREERFSQDPSLPYSCTGFLVAPDLIATAGHCMVNTGESHNETDKYCQAYSWLFDYQNPSAGPLRTNEFPSSNLYHCKQVVYAVKDASYPFRDFALVQLDRPVLDRAPLRLASADVAENDPVSMIGYPFGTPAKYSGDAKIILNKTSRQSFITNLDAFEGNSGSPVFNRAQEVIGILVGGTPSQAFYQDGINKCDHYNRCDINGKNCILPDADTSVFPEFQQTGSEVQRIAPLSKLIRDGKFRGR